MKKTIKDAAIGGGLSLAGSCLGKVTSFGYEMKGSAMVNSGKTKLLAGSLRKTLWTVWEQFDSTRTFIDFKRN